MTYKEMSEKMTKSWMAGYLLAVEDMQADLEKAKETMSGPLLNRYMETKIKNTLKEARNSLNTLGAK